MHIPQRRTTAFTFSHLTALGLSFITPLLGFAAAARAADITEEQREYRVLVDGKPAGAYRLTVAKGNSGETIAFCEADVRVRVLFFDYAYTYRGREVWRQDQPLRVDARADDGGKKSAVSASRNGNAVDLSVNGQVRRDAAFGWTTSYWRLPSGAGQPQTMRILDVDTGQMLNARLSRVSSERLEIEGQPLACNRYRLDGEAQVELWYDQFARLVRQSSLEEGHRTEIVLATIRRPAALSMR